MDAGKSLRLIRSVLISATVVFLIGCNSGSSGDDIAAEDAAYDLTGEWTIITHHAYSSDGEYDPDEVSRITIDQNGKQFSMSDDEGQFCNGSINGNVYTADWDESEEDGTSNIKLSVSADSNDTLSGTLNIEWTGVYEIWKGTYDISGSRVSGNQSGEYNGDGNSEVSRVDNINVTMDDGLGHSSWTLTVMTDGSAVIDGEFVYSDDGDDVTCPFVSSAATVAGDLVAFTATGTATHSGISGIGRNSEFILQVHSNIYIINFMQDGWPTYIQGTFTVD